MQQSEIWFRCHCHWLRAPPSWLSNCCIVVETPQLCIVKRATTLFIAVAIEIWSKREDHRWYIAAKRFGCRAQEESPRTFRTTLEEFEGY